ncbi:MAG: acyltransferase family protein [Promethearchaeota archaeon]
MIEPSSKETHLEDTHYVQIDLLKAIAIILVILNHSLPWYYEILAPYWTRASIPIFMIIMGLNAALSFRRRGQLTLRKLYSGSYFRRKGSRYLFPFLLLLAASFLAGWYFQELDIKWSIFLGILPFWGPGNWFIPVIFTSVFFLPLIFWSFEKHPKATVLATFLIDLTMHVIFTTYIRPMNLEMFSLVWTIFRCNVLILLFAVGIGFWLSNGHDLTNRHNYAILALAIPSIIYLGTWTFLKIELPFLSGDYVPFVYPYSGLLVLLGMKLLPSEANNLASRSLETVGKATYHILLFQIFYFSIMFQLFPIVTLEAFGEAGWAVIAYSVFSLGVTISGGLLWFKAEMIARQWCKAAR